MRCRTCSPGSCSCGESGSGKRALSQRRRLRALVIRRYVMTLRKKAGTFRRKSASGIAERDIL
jgi:hypothetical protein